MTKRPKYSKKKKKIKKIKKVTLKKYGGASANAGASAGASSNKSEQFLIKNHTYDYIYLFNGSKCMSPGSFFNSCKGKPKNIETKDKPKLTLNQTPKSPKKKYKWYSEGDENIVWEVIGTNLLIKTPILDVEPSVEKNINKIKTIVEEKTLDKIQRNDLLNSLLKQDGQIKYLVPNYYKKKFIMIFMGKSIDVELFSQEKITGEIPSAKEISDLKTYLSKFKHYSIDDINISNVIKKKTPPTYYIIDFNIKQKSPTKSASASSNDGEWE